MEGKQVIPYADPYYLGNSDNSNTPLGTIVFNGKNYVNWSRSVRMALGAKNKLGFIEGKIPKLNVSSDDYNQWIRNDCMIRCWLSASVTPQIAEQMLIVNSAREFWTELAERFGQSNAPQIYMLRKELNGLKQNNMSVSEYFGKLKARWDQLNSLEGMPECTCGIFNKCTCNVMKKLLERKEKKKVMDFLMGLNDGYDNQKENIIGMDPLPSVNRAHQMVLQVEKQKEISGLDEVGSEASALLAAKPFHGNKLNNRQNYKNNYQNGIIGEERPRKKKKRNGVKTAK
ncbi:uncharacterized protein LOC110693369 [Chenopodium quinoa]|uniref:uncharacterized protein LOC110693369 n=1 Tax=Chenopodium quinoa TaxID=63459 RepID=UPI000B79463D|nr:uncharacterized protein LOC110693369 [Chenopodium quinoa]